MNLSNYLIDKFAKATVNKQKVKKETTVYGTVQITDGKPYVKIDGSNILTPVTTTADIQTGNRVIVQLKDHGAVVTGNISVPSASSSTVSEITINQQTVDRVDKENQAIKEALTGHTNAINTITTDIANIKKSLNELTSIKRRLDDIEERLEELENK